MKAAMRRSRATANGYAELAAGGVCHAVVDVNMNLQVSAGFASFEQAGLLIILAMSYWLKCATPWAVAQHFHQFGTRLTDHLVVEPLCCR
jgi:hypothetical protein